MPRLSPYSMFVRLLYVASATALIAVIWTELSSKDRNCSLPQPSVNASADRTSGHDSLSPRLPVRRHRLLPAVAVEAVNCSTLFRGTDDDEIRAADQLNVTDRRPPSTVTAWYVNQTGNCRQFKASRQYLTRPINAEEEDFPLAFSILLYTDVDRFERLLRAIYRPQNLYCVHADSRTNASIGRAVTAIVSCFHNVFEPEERIKVTWGTFSVLKAELICMEELLRRGKKWKYFINLTGQEFPLKTNWQIVRILKAFNGSNNLEGTAKRRNLDRFVGLPPPPVNVTLTKGSVHITATRGFVNFVIHNSTAKLFLEWVKKSQVPEETFFTSLNHSPQLGVPGSYLGKPETDRDTYPFFTRFKSWEGNVWNSWPCGGKRVRTICVFGLRDLPLLASRPEMFANKFHSDYKPLAYDCMEQRYFDLVRRELDAGDEISSTFNTSLYESFAFVRNHL